MVAGKKKSAASPKPAGKKASRPAKPAGAGDAPPEAVRDTAQVQRRKAAAAKAVVAKAIHEVLHPAPPRAALETHRAGGPAPSVAAAADRSAPAAASQAVAPAEPPVTHAPPEPPPAVARPEPQVAAAPPEPLAVSASLVAGIAPQPAEQGAPAPAPAAAAATAPAADPPQPAPRPPSEAAASAPPPPPAADMPIPDFEALSRNMAKLVEDSGKLAAQAYAGDQPPTLRADVADAVQTLGLVAEHWFGEPARLVQAQASLTAQFFDLWAASAARLAAPAEQPTAEAAPPPSDKRFRDPAWRENPVFDFVHRAFLLGSRWANDLVEGTEGLDDATKEKARFYVRQVTSAMSPSNFVPTNPELLRETLRENGGNLLRGLKMLSEDLAAGNGQLRIRHTDTSKFAIGVNMALSPGKVVYRNDLMELLQYAPSTAEVLQRPLLIVPPWINKFYVLDLNPEKSFIRWAVAQGLTVFVISWVNPDERHAEKDFEAYMREGVLTALTEIEAITGEAAVTAIGYCVGGTLLAVTLAHMAAEGDRRIASATLFTAQVDFTHAGDLKVFAAEGQIKALEGQMRGTGYLQGTQMAQAFNMLRPDELIWSYWVNNYLRGKEPPAFDLLAWNSDSTRMPAANHSFYLRNCYLENKLARGLMEIAGRTLDMGQVTVPIYNLATREDHIAPAISVFEGCKFFGGPVRYVLSGSGHVAGVVNPPSRAKYGFWDGPDATGSFEDWLAAAVEHKGSWWPDWFEWIRAQAPALVPAREPGGGRPTLGEAPGSYVKVRA